MAFELIVAADVFVRVFTAGEERWEEIGHRVHQIVFDRVEICEEARREFGGRLENMLEAEARAWWLKELGVVNDNLRVDTSAECYDYPD